MCDFSLRCGIPAQLRASQIYPPGYGKAICKYHRKWLDPWLNVSYPHSTTQSVSVEERAMGTWRIIPWLLNPRVIKSPNHGYIIFYLLAHLCCENPVWCSECCEVAVTSQIVRQNLTPSKIFAMPCIHLPVSCWTHSSQR